MPTDMRREFTSRDDLVAYLAAEFPAAAAVSPAVSATVGGRAAAERLLGAIDPRRYAATRNFLSGAVTRLSAYLRHGVLSLAEVRAATLRAVANPEDARKLISELGWRDYWQRLYVQIGDGIWHDRESYKTGEQPAAYAAALPVDIVEGRTGLACMDAFRGQLVATGYLHNHARMWLAAYVVHWRRVAWQAGAGWFLEHLLDGDPASNNLSWQWVASTFSHKPYFFNRENLERYTDDAYCRDCTLRERCPLDGSYDELAQRLFPRSPGDARTAGVQERQARRPANPTDARSPVGGKPAGQPIVWVHGDCLSPYGPALAGCAGAPALFVFDDALLAERRVSLKRLVFIYECLLELPVVIRRGDVASEVLAFAAEHGAAMVVTSTSPSPRFAVIRRAIAARLPVRVLPVAPFVVPPRPPDLARFSRYWRAVEADAMRPAE